MIKMITFLSRLYHYSVNLLSKTARRILPEGLKKRTRKILRIRERKIIAQHRAILDQILQGRQAGKDYRTIVIFPPSLVWDVQLFQRPQQLALALARQGALVFYIQPKPDRNKPPFSMIAERLYLCNVYTETFQEFNTPFIYLLTWNSGYATCVNNPRIIYDYVDDINVFYGDHQEIAKGHQYLLRNAYLVLATARKLVDNARTYRTDVIYSPNGVVFDHFAHLDEREFTPPADLAPILAQGCPLIGYYGALARWFNYDLLKSIAILRPNYQFVLIGPDYDGTLEPAKITQMPNIHCLGVKTYEQLPNYLHYFDVATIPFIVNEITHATSPLKLFEYMAGGKPIVITPMQESMQYKGVLVAETAEDFVVQLDRALLLRDDPNYQNEIKNIAQQNTWESRAEEILRTIELKRSI